MSLLKKKLLESHLNYSRETKALAIDYLPFVGGKEEHNLAMCKRLSGQLATLAGNPPAPQAAIESPELAQMVPAPTSGNSLGTVL